MKSVASPLGWAASVVIIATASAYAQSYTVLKSFAGGNDGDEPFAPVVVSANTIYGTTYLGGTSNHGTVFKLRTDGSGYSVLKSFTGGIDGSRPQTGVTVSGGVLYGTTEYGGNQDVGTVFRLNTDGSGYTVLKSFESGTNDAFFPYGELILSDDTL